MSYSPLRPVLARRFATAVSTWPRKAGLRKLMSTPAATVMLPVLARARVGRVAGEGEGGVAEGEDHSAVGHAEAVEHFLPERHADRGMSVVQRQDFDAHPFRGVVVFQDGVGAPGNRQFSHASLPPALFTECSLGNPIWVPAVKGCKYAGTHGQRNLRQRDHPGLRQVPHSAGAGGHAPPARGPDRLLQACGPRHTTPRRTRWWR